MVRKKLRSIQEKFLLLQMKKLLLNKLMSHDSKLTQYCQLHSKMYLKFANVS